jgi:hypothetical protein
MKYIHYEIAIILANLFKGLPMLSDIRINVINKLKHNNNVNELGNLAEHRGITINFF